MALEDTNEIHHLRRDTRDAHTNAATARMLATIALIAAAVALALSIMAWNKANDTWGNAQRAVNSTSSLR